MEPKVQFSLFEGFFWGLLRTNTRKRLLKKLKRNPSNEIRDKVRALNCEIRNFYYGRTKQNVRRNMIPGNSKSLWDAVKIAKDLNIEPIPTNMYGEGELLTHADMPDHFASFFNKKVIDIMNTTVIDNEIYNGVKRVEASDMMFMDKRAIKECH